MIDLPNKESRKWSAAQNGDLFGTVVRTKNMDFGTDGYAILARKALTWYSEDDDANFQIPVAIAGDDTYAYVITTDNCFAVDIASDTLPFSELTTSNAPSTTNQSDAEFYQGLLHVSGSTTVKSYSGGTGGSWTSRISGLSSSYPHPLCVNDQRQTLLVGNGNVVRQYDSSYTRDTSNELTLDPQYVVTCIRYKGNVAYIGTKNIYGGHAKVFLWNCVGTGYNEAHSVQADWVYSMTEFESSMAAIVSSGQLLKYNGGGFDELAALPVYYTPYSWASSQGTASLLGKVASRGMTTIGDTIYMNVDGSLRNSQTQYPGQYLPEQPSGVWTFDRSVGLVHRAAANHKSYRAYTPTAVASNYLVFSSAHGLVTGDPILCQAVGTISGTTAGQIYYAIVDDDASTTTCKIAVSPDDALEGRYVSISGTPTTDKFAFDRYESMGHTKVVSVGGIFAFSRTIPNLFYGSEVLFGVNVTDETATSKAVACSLGMGRNEGWMVTPWIQAAGVTDFYQRLYTLFNELNLTTDEVVVKYRTEKEFGFPKPLGFTSTQSWTSDDTFTVDTTQHDFRGVIEGDEVEFVLGNGAGYCANISDIDKTTSTYAVTIDRSLPVVNTNKMDFVVERWKELNVFDADSEDNPRGYGKTNIDDIRGRKAQFKITLRGRNIAVELLSLVNSINKPAT